MTVTNNGKAKITINSFTVSAHTSAADAASGANPIGSVSGTYAASTDFLVPKDQNWVGCYLRVTYNLTKTDTSGNGYVQFGGLTVMGWPSE